MALKKYIVTLEIVVTMTDEQAEIYEKAPIELHEKLGNSNKTKLSLVEAGDDFPLPAEEHWGEAY